MYWDDVKTALTRGKLPHAMLFLGPQNSGQREAVLELAKRLGIGSDKHPDFHWIEPEQDSRTLKIEAVRAVIAQANLKPFQAPCKLFVLDRAEAMKEETQSALLKTLEEPPPQTYFVLISYAAERMLSTIRSRAQEVRFSQKDSLAEPDPENEEAERAVLDYLLGKPAPDLSGLSREQALKALESVIRDLRGALLAGIGAARAEGKPGVAALAERYSSDELVRRIETLAAFKEKVAQNVNTKLALAVLWDEL